MNARAVSGAKRVALAVLAALSVGACSTANDMLTGKKIDYKSAGQLPPLEIPPDLTSPSRDNRYAVPDVSKNAATLSSYEAAQRSRPAASSGVLPTIERMRIERSGSQRWLVINESPEKLWPLVKEFWQENGFLMQTDNPEAGVMETDWAENRAKIPMDMLRATLGKLVDQIYSTPERDRFRTRLERGNEPNTTEIYISHRGMIEIYNTEARSSTVWQPRPADPELEAEFLRRLMIRLGVQEERAKAQIASAPQALRATLGKQSDGSEKLEVLEPFDRAWRRVGLALDRVGFTVEDRDRAKGVYFVRYADPEKEMNAKDAEKPGLLGKFAFWRSNTAAKVSAEQYRVLISEAGTNTQVRILNKDGASESSQTTKRILSLLHDQLK